jgi:hypothetical protein
MSYARIAATAEAKRFIDEREQKDRAERARGGPGARMMGCGLTCSEWLEIYLKRNLPATVVEHNTETDHDDQDRREATGTEAGPVSAGEGVGDPAGEESAGAGREAESVGISKGEAEGSWIDDAYPEGSQGADFTGADLTPF